MELIPWGSFYVWTLVEEMPLSEETHLGFFPEAPFGCHFEEVIWTNPTVLWIDGSWVANNGFEKKWTIRRLGVEAPGMTHWTTLDKPSSGKPV